LADDSEEVDPDVDEAAPDVVVDCSRVLEPEDEDVASQGHGIEEQEA